MWLWQNTCWSAKTSSTSFRAKTSTCYIRWSHQPDFAVRQEQAQTATELLAGLDSDPSCDTEEERAEQPTEGTFKSVRVSIILTVLLGPLGMFYSTVGGATIMTLTALVVGPAIGYGVLVMWPVCIVCGVFATRSYNDRQGRMGRTSPGVTVDERLFTSRQKK